MLLLLLRLCACAWLKLRAEEVLTGFPQMWGLDQLSLSIVRAKVSPSVVASQILFSLGNGTRMIYNCRGLNAAPSLFQSFSPVKNQQSVLRFSKPNWSSPARPSRQSRYMTSSPKSSSFSRRPPRQTQPPWARRVGERWGLPPLPPWLQVSHLPIPWKPWSGISLPLPNHSPRK